MSSVPQKGNISRLLLAVTLLAVISVLVIVASRIFSFGIRSGKYVNPIVASHVVEGTVYDRSGRPLSMQVPVYDEEGNTVSRTRTYPANFHAAQLISEVEDRYSSLISPRPGFSEAVTYGSDIYLTLDFDIQYILDLAVQDVYRIQRPGFVTAFILDAQTGEVRAASNYPYYDLNEQKIKSENRTYISNLSIDGKVFTPTFISKIENYMGQVVSTGKDLDLKADGFTADLPSTISMVSRANRANSSIITALPSTEPKYYVFIGSWNPTESIDDNSALLNAVAVVESGMRSQNKI